MRAGNAEVAARKLTARSCVSNGRDILPDVDGQSIVAPRCRDILAALVSDQGGADRMIVQLCRRFTALVSRPLFGAGARRREGSTDVGSHASGRMSRPFETHDLA